MMSSAIISINNSINPSTHRGMVLTQTPFRVSFFGGGTDFPHYFNDHSGFVIGTTIDKCMYVSLNSLERFYEQRIRLSYSKLEIADHPSEIHHPIIRTILENHPLIDQNTFIDLNTFADLPSGSGMGSSSVFTVGMLNALYSLNGIHCSAHEIAKEAIKIERDDLKEAGGWQDQIFAAHGGFNKISFNNNDYSIQPLEIPTHHRTVLEDSCIMCFTGDTRSSANIQESVMRKPTDKTNYLHDIKAIAYEAYETLTSAISPEKLILQFGSLLNTTWEAKRRLSANISNDKIEALYQKGLSHGAIGGKLCGAGGGGFILFIVPPDLQNDFFTSFNSHKLMKIRFQKQGSTVAFTHHIR